MLAPALVAEIRRLLAETCCSQRQIAKLTGVSRNTVGTIAAGRHRYDSVEETPRDEGVDEPAGPLHAVGGRMHVTHAVDEPAGPPQRCPGCGGLVYMPCILCRTNQRAARRTPRTAANGDVSLALQLRPDHRARYEAVRQKREAGLETGS